MSTGKRMKESKSKNKGKSNIFFYIVAIIYVIITAIFCASIFNLDLLPGKYLTIFTIMEAIITILLLIGLIKKHKTLKLNIICLIIIVIISSVYIYANNYVNATIKFLNSMFNEAIETEEYYVIVQKDSQYNKISDLKDKEMIFFQIEDDVRQEVENKVDITLTKKESLLDVGNALIDGTAESMIISLSQYNMLSEEIEIFKENTKIIYTATHIIRKVDIGNSKYNVANKCFNIYISGIDTTGDISNVARSDANILATVNLETNEILLTSIPRDYYVTLHSYGAKDKLTHSGIYGINETVQTVEDLLDIEINYYVRVNFTTVIKLVDELGGIDVYSDYTFTTNEGYKFTKGYNTLNGEEALAFSRERYSFTEGDNQRVKNQQKVISAILDKVTSSTTILTKYTNILDSLEGCFQTNMKQEDISDIVKQQLNSMASWTVKSNSLTGSDAYSSTYSMGSQELYVMIPDTDSVEQATEKINEVLQ